jgi:hypothetical protein
MNAMNGTTMTAALRWALQAAQDPSMAAADWLASDIDPDTAGAVALLTDEHTSLDHLRKAKSAFKTMRIVGETKADRRLGARLYLAAIAAARVRHGVTISRQADAALARALESLARDAGAPGPLRTLGGMALCAIRDLRPKPPPPGSERAMA